MKSVAIRGRVREERGAFNGSFVLVVIMFIVFGIALIDGGSILFAKLQLQDLAETAATDAAAEYRKNGSETAAYEAAVRIVEERDKAVTVDEESFSVDPADATVTITLTKDASVLFIDKIPPLEDFVSMTATVETPGAII